MKRSLQRGEIATIVAIGTLVIIGVASLFSSAFLGKKQVTSSKAQVACDDPKWKCGPECANESVRRVYGGNSDKWREEAGKIYGGCDKEDKPIPPTPSCPGKYDNNGSCNPACCESDSNCPSGETCSNSNGFCKSTKSCKAASTSPAPSKPPETGSGGGDCAWGDWTCATAGGNNDAGRICGKMGKSLCAPGDGRSDGAGKVCQKNQWDDKWGCWGPGLSTQTSTPYGYCNLTEGSCSQRSQQDPKEHYLKWFKCSSGEWKGPFDSENTCKGGTSTSGGTNCKPGQGGPGPGGKYYCCYEAGKGPEGGKKLPFPHYEDEGNKEVNCEEKTGVSLTTKKEEPPANCGQKSYKLSVDRKYICGQGSEDEKFSYENGWCCEPIQGSTAIIADNCSIAGSVTCDDGTKKSYYTGYDKNRKITGFYKEKKDCTAGGKPDALKTAVTDADKKKLLCATPCVNCHDTGGTITGNCTDTDYILDNQTCGANGWCGPKQKKYTKTSNNTCNGAVSKCINDSSCGSPTTNPNLSCALATKIGGCWITYCDSTSALMGVPYTCKQDLAGWAYCCPPGTNPPNSNSGGTSSVVTVTAPENITITAPKDSCYWPVINDIEYNCCLTEASIKYICTPK